MRKEGLFVKNKIKTISPKQGVSNHVYYIIDYHTIKKVD